MGGVTDPHISVVSTPPKLGAQMRIHGGGTSGGHRPQYQIPPPPHHAVGAHVDSGGGGGTHMGVWQWGGVPSCDFWGVPPLPPPQLTSQRCPGTANRTSVSPEGGGSSPGRSTAQRWGGGGELGCTPHKSRPPPQQMGYGPPPNTMNAFGLQLHAGELRQNSAAVGGEGVLGGALESPPQDPPLPR